MKFTAMVFTAILSLGTFAASSPMECLKIKNALDRKYCLDKNLEAIKTSQAQEKKSWGKGLPAKDKSAKTTAAQDSISAKKEYIAHLQNELALEEKHLEALKALPVAKEAKKKKEKKKKGFRIKL